MASVESEEHRRLKFAGNPRSTTTVGNEEETWELT